MKATAMQRYAVLAAAMAMLAGCAKEDILIKNTPKGATYVTATMPASAKTTYSPEPGNTTNPSLNVQWESEDFFYGLMIGNSEQPTGVKFTNADGTISPSATFRADVYHESSFNGGSLQLGSKIFAIYPSEDVDGYFSSYSDYVDYYENSYYYFSLDEQPGTLEGLKDFDIMTAVAGVEEGENDDVICDLRFKHETAILHIQSLDVNETSGTAEDIKLKADGLANYVYFMPNNSGWESDTDKGKINIDPVEFENNKLPDLYISVMPGTLSNIKLTFRVGDNKGYKLDLTTHDGSPSKEIVAGKMYTVTAKPLAFSTLYSVPELEDNTELNSVTNPYKITNIAELEYVRYHLDGHYSLYDNITLPDGEDWEPIGDNDNRFTGTFDGKKHTISNIKIDNGKKYQGFFGYVASAGTVKDLTVTGTISANGYVGGIAGYNNGTITGCTNNVSLTAKGEDAYCGGIAGRNQSGTITNCRNTAAIVGEGDFQYIGGIVGYFSAGSITFCTNRGAITGEGEDYSFVGGIAGESDNLIEACTNIATITGGASAKIGGIVGWGEKCLGCANKGSLVSSSSVVAGGIMGYANSSSIITACYNTGGHSGDGTFYQISNNSSIVTNCYSGEEVVTPANIEIMNTAWEGDENSSGKYVFNGTGEIVEKD